jgi:ABC-type lipoprotein export system ATPase subunit
MTPALLRIDGLVKAHQGLRPLRIQSLSVHAGDVVSLSGLDALAAEVLVHTITGAALPDDGRVELFGQDTRSIASSEAWLRSLDALGLLSARAVLIEQFTVSQNIAMPFTLEVDPISDEIRPKVDALAREVGIDPAAWGTPVGAADATVQFKVRLARAIALGPTLVVAEHPSARLPRTEVRRVTRELAALAASRRFALLGLTADDEFANALGGRQLYLRPSTGELAASHGLFGRLFPR